LRFLEAIHGSMVNPMRVSSRIEKYSRTVEQGEKLFARRLVISFVWNSERSLFQLTPTRHLSRNFSEVT